MADNTLNIAPPFKFEVKTPPRGMTDYDPAAIHPNQQEQLNIYKMNLRKENIRYVASHPEMKALFHYMANEMWRIRPRKTYEHMTKMYRRPEAIIRRELKKIIAEESLQIEELAESDSEDWDY